MTKFKDFGSGSSEQKEAVSFKLHGEDFACRPAIQGKLLIDLAKDAASEDAAAAAETIEKFFANVLTPEDSDRFQALLVDPDRIVEVETLTEIISWLMEVYTDRPNQQPEA
jgi:hypothetical protein